MCHLPARPVYWSLITYRTYQAYVRLNTPLFSSRVPWPLQQTDDLCALVAKLPHRTAVFGEQDGVLDAATQAVDD